MRQPYITNIALFDQLKSIESHPPIMSICCGYLGTEGVFTESEVVGP